MVAIIPQLAYAYGRSKKMTNSNPRPAGALPGAGEGQPVTPASQDQTKEKKQERRPRLHYEEVR